MCRGTPAYKDSSRAHWEASLAEIASFLFSRRPCLTAATHREIEEDTAHSALDSTCVHTYRYAHPYTHMNHTHPHKTTNVQDLETIIPFVLSTFGAYLIGYPCFHHLGWKWKAPFKIRFPVPTVPNALLAKA